MPPPTITIENEEIGSNSSASSKKKGSGRIAYSLGIPTRHEETGEYTFEPGDDASSSLIEKLKEFKPNRSPEEVMRSGSFGGTYFRPIVSAVTNMKYKSSDVLNESVQKEWIDGLNA